MLNQAHTVTSVWETVTATGKALNQKKWFLVLTVADQVWTTSSSSIAMWYVTPLL